MRWRLLPTRANGQLAFGDYHWDGEGFAGEGIAVLTVRDTRIQDLTVFRTPELLERFGLPARLDA